jgi:hypothetical protein
VWQLLCHWPQCCLGTCRESMPYAGGPRRSSSASLQCMSAGNAARCLHCGATASVRPALLLLLHTCLLLSVALLRPSRQQGLMVLFPTCMRCWHVDLCIGIQGAAGGPALCYGSRTELKCGARATLRPAGLAPHCRPGCQSRAKSVIAAHTVFAAVV